MFREALLHAKKEVLYFLKKAAPKKVTGTVRFGFDDPALTGETLGILGMIYGKLPKDLSIQPDFEQEILQGDVRMKGSFQAVTAAGIALRLFRDQNTTFQTQGGLKDGRKGQHISEYRRSTVPWNGQLYHNKDGRR